MVNWTCVLMCWRNIKPRVKNKFIKLISYSTAHILKFIKPSHKMDEHEDDLNQTIKSPIKRYGSTRKIYLYNSKYWRSTIYFSLAISQFNKKKITHRERKMCENYLSHEVLNKLISIERYKRKISWPLFNFSINVAPQNLIKQKSWKRRKKKLFKAGKWCV